MLRLRRTRVGLAGAAALPVLAASVLAVPPQIMTRPNARTDAG